MEASVRRRARRISLTAMLITLAACNNDERADPYDLDFEIPRTEAFALTLSDYGLFEAPLADLQPTDGTLLYELSSELFTDYAYKQRLVRVPEGSSISVGADEGVTFPEGSVLVKTFYYPEDMREPEGARRIIETRLLVKREGTWNVATYLWNDEQTEATLMLDGTTTQMAWTDASGNSRSTEYAVPHEGECVTCHQSEGSSIFIGPTLRNLNRKVLRDGAEINQLEYLVANGALEPVDAATSSSIPNYKDTSLSLEQRTRVYLDSNCAHCHNPDGWDEATDRDFDFRYEASLDDTGLSSKGQRISRVLENGKMPWLGTTMLHAEGVDLVLSYLDGQ